MQKNFLTSFFLGAIPFLVSVVLSQRVRWSDSELWSIATASRSAVDADATGIYKILFDGLLGLLYKLPLNSLQTIEGGRLMFGILGGITVLLLYFLGKTLWDRATGIVAAILWVSSELWLTQAFRVRSDLLVLIFFLAACLAWACAIRSAVRRAPLRGLALVLALGMVLSSIKGVYHLLIFASFAYLLAMSASKSVSVPVRVPFRTRGDENYHGLLRIGALALGAFWLLFMLSYAHQFQDAWTYYLRSFAGNNFKPAAFSLEAFLHVKLFLLKNPVHALGLCIAIGGLLTRGWLEGWLKAPFALSLVLIFFHNERLPFFILSLLPFPILAIARVGLGFFSGRAFYRNMRTVTLLVIASLAIWHGWEVWYHRSNRTQLAAFGKIEDYVAQTDPANFYDGLGLLNRRPQTLAFPVPEAEGTWPLVRGILTDPHTELVFVSNRLFYFFHEIHDILGKDSFISVGNGVFARAAVIETRHPTADHPLLQTWCRSKPAKTEFHLYLGESFIAMKPTQVISREALCENKTWALPLEAAGYTHFALSKFGPLDLGGTDSFALVFGNDFSEQ